MGTLDHLKDLPLGPVPGGAAGANGANGANGAPGAAGGGSDGWQPAVPLDYSLRYDGLVQSPNRTYILMPQVSGADDITQWDRKEGYRKALWLHSNVGLVGAFTDRLATKTVGNGMRVQALTADDDWNRRVQDAFNEKAESAVSCDACGKWTFAQAQWHFMQQEMLAGDFFAGLTEAKGSGSAQFLLYTAGQIGDDGEMRRGEQGRGWLDGVRTAGPGRPVAFRVLKPGGGHKDVSAADMVHFATNRPPGARRGITRLIRALNHIVDIVDNRASLKAGIGLANQIGYYLRTQLGGSALGIGGGMGAVLGQEAEKVAATSKEKVKMKEIKVEQNGVIPALGVNQTLETLKDDRPHANGREFEKDLIADIALGCGVLPQVVTDILGLGNNQGRLALQDLQEFVEPRQLALARTFCARFYVYWLAKEMKAGRLPEPSGDARWWRHGWLAPRKVTIDVGREGALEIKQQDMGLLTLSDFFGCRSKDWKAQVDQGIAEKVYKWHKVLEARGEDPAQNPPPLSLFYSKGQLGTGTSRIPDGSDTTTTT